jgi:hypothetical protein
LCGCHHADLERHSRRNQMANKLPKRLFGTLGSAATPHIPVRIYPTGASEQAGYIVNQVGARRFTCATTAAASPPVANQVYKIVQGTNMDPTAEGEMTIIGILNGSPVALKKLNFRTAADFSGNRYKWTLDDDSSETLLILTAINPST